MAQRSVIYQASALFNPSKVFLYFIIFLQVKLWGNVQDVEINIFFNLDLGIDLFWNLFAI